MSGAMQPWLKEVLRGRMPSRKAFQSSLEALEARNSLTSGGFIRSFRSFPHGPKPSGPSKEWAPAMRVLAPFHPQVPMPSQQRMSEQKKFFSYLGFSRASQLRQAEKDANANPGDSTKQADFCSLLNRSGMSSEVIKRYESRQFAVNDSVLQEYVRALIATNVISENQFNSTLDALRNASGMQGAQQQQQQNVSGNFLGQTPPNSRFSQAAASASARPWGTSASGGGGSAFPGGGGGGYQNIGTMENPVIVEQKPRKPTLLDVLATLSKIGMSIFLIYILYKVFMKKGGANNPFENITGGPPEDTGDIPDTRFEDVRGVDEAKEELREVVQYLQYPEKYQALGARVPKGILLTGPPGTGKTMLARAVAGEAGVKFYSKSASEFEEMLVGLGAKRVRELFDTAKQNAPSIIFIDEIDAMGAKRRNVNVGGNSERQTLNQLLACLDGFDKNDNVVVLAATNDEESLDGALRRPGRFDSQVPVPKPDMRGRTEIFKSYLSKVKVSADVSAELLAKQTPGCTGADIAALINSAAIMAASRGGEVVELTDLEEARDKQLMGPGLKSRKKTTEQLRLTAYHEAGHTIVNLFTDGGPELHKVTVLSRGQSGGATYYFPKDEGNMTRKEILAKIDLAFGGMIAEELVNGEENLSTGPMGDLQGASDLARQYVKYFGMSKLGFSQFTGGEYNNPDGRPSEQTRAKIDEEVESLLRNSYERAKSCILEHRTELEYLANALMEHETLNEEQVRKVIRGEEIPLTPEQLRAKEQEEELERKRKDEAKKKSSSGGGWGFLGLGSSKKSDEESNSGTQEQAKAQQTSASSATSTSASANQKASAHSNNTERNKQEASPVVRQAENAAAKVKPSASASQPKQQENHTNKSTSEEHKSSAAENEQAQSSSSSSSSSQEQEVPEGATEKPNKGKRRWN